ncbi:hypothetical protein X738_13020 [Mesorhizobium sp. LNHC209A00]|nr:hypothetical protein X738_13020 [Mesorhizobium sp. LNHC209A00]
MLPDAEAAVKSALAEWLKFERIRRGLLPQRAFGGALAVVGEQTLRRTQYATIRPVGSTVSQVAVIIGKPRCPIGQAAFDAEIGVRSGKDGIVPVDGLRSPVDLSGICRI